MHKTFFFTALILVPSFFVTASYADNVKHEIVNVDGREVLLNEDGSWHFRSSDRFANTRDGRRVRLKADGSWQYMGNAPMASKQQVRTAELDIKLQQVVIETYKKKVQKNSRIKTQTVFYLSLDYSPQAKDTLRMDNSDISLIQVKDNNGRIYPVVSLKPGIAELKPDTNTTLVIRAEKSPSIWDDVKSMAITFNSGIFDLQAPITLSQRSIDFAEKNVDGFENN